MKESTMKLTVFMMAFTAMLSVGVVSCSKENNDNSNGGNNGGGNSGSGITTVEWVDLGLPSGLLWAACNLGASDPGQYGNYYAWGETQPKEIYNWSTYRYCTVDSNGVLKTLTKYNTISSRGEIDSLTVLEPGDDAATVNLGNGARTPTREEWEELINYCTATWTSQNGRGTLMTGPNGNSIFFPIAGSRYNSTNYFVHQRGYYLSSSLYDEDPLQAWCLLLSTGGGDCWWLNHKEGSRRDGFSVRAVRQQ